MRAPRAVFGASVAVLALLVTATTTWAANPTPVQLFYVPFPEDQLLAGLQAIENGGSGAAPASPVTTYVSIAAIAPNTIIYYDHWENGYDPDIANPANLYSGGNPGGTQIWGNANPADGAPPGIPSDVINAGTVIVLSNAINTANLLAIDFDGRDKFAATKTVAVTRIGWGTGPNTLLAGALEVFDTDNWGTDHRVPVGQDIPDSTDFQMFEYTSLAIMAGEGGATVQIDADANGVFETNVVLSEGQSHFVSGGVNAGGRVVSDHPVQVDMLTGDVASSYESRDSALLPTNLWATSYYTPVSTASSAQGISGTATTVWLYNPGAANLTVAYTTRDGGGNLTTVNLSVPGGPNGGVLKQVIPDGYGARFAAATPFYAFSTTDSTNSTTSGGQYPNNQAWDWGYTLVPEDSLTPQVLIGLGIGRDPTSGTNPSENGNPVWVTPVGNGDTPVTVYVDFDGDPTTGPLTDPNGNKYNVALSLRELERAKIYDTSDNNQTGMLVYTLTTGVKLAAAWGQDPLVASAAAPGLDVGSGVPPLPLFATGKNGTLDLDNDGDGFISPGDQLLYTISIVNISRAPVPDILLKDTLPPGTTYVANSTFFTDAAMVTTPIPDDGVGTPFPLDGAGKVVNPITALPVGGSYTVTFKVVIASFPGLPPGTSDIVNVCSATAVGSTVPCLDRTPLNGCIGDFVWHDVDGDAVQDGGPEAGIPTVTLELWKDVNGNGVIDGGDVLLGTKITNGAGNYLFTGVLAGDYVVNVVEATLPPGYALTTANEPFPISLAGGECNLNADFGYRNPCIPANCDDGNPCTTDTCNVGVGCMNTPAVGLLCRAANGACDVPEHCDAGGNCPADGFASSSTTCRTSAGVCDVAENCTGSSAACPTDGFASSSTTCRISAGVCDVAENCTGSSATCPPDGFDTGTQCRAAAGDCDVAEVCNGSGPSCPTNGFVPGGTICRAQSGDCDVAETCTGNAAACPPDGVASGATVCRPIAGACDVEEKCDGVGKACPADGVANTGTPCSDGSFCTLNDVCDAIGGCVPGTPVDCDDDNICTDDTCDSGGGGFLCVHTNNGVCIGENCGNMMVDTADGETCDPPNPALDPVTNQVLCRLDCTRCGDGVQQANNQESCDDGNTASGCQPDQPQKPIDDCQNNCSPPICADPSRIKFGNEIDLFKFHGRLIADQSLDLANQHFVIELETAGGTLVFRSSVVAGSLEPSGTNFRYKDKGARLNGGLALLKAKYRSKGYYIVTLQAYGQLDLAETDMTTHVNVGDARWSLRGLWKKLSRGWSLSSKSVLLQPD